MPPQLVALTEGPSIVLDKPILVFGRDPECDIRFDSRKISRKHCCIAQVADYLVVRDLGSTNGIRINGVRVVEGSLRAGDELTVGSHRYQVRWDELAVAARPTARPKPPEPPPRDATAREGHDDILELCDDPVPLPDSPGGRAPPPASDPREAEGLELDDHSPHGLQPDDRPSAIIPEQISLAPVSKILPIKPPPKPPTK